MGTFGTPLQYVIVDVWVRSFIEPTLFDNYVPFDNTIADLSYQSALEIRLSINVQLRELHYFSIFRENNANGGEENAGVEKAGVENAGVNSRGGKCRSEKCRSRSHGWKCRSGKYRSDNVWKAVKHKIKILNILN